MNIHTIYSDNFRLQFKTAVHVVQHNLAFPADVISTNHFSDFVKRDNTDCAFGPKIQQSILKDSDFCWLLIDQFAQVQNVCYSAITARFYTHPRIKLKVSKYSSK